MNRQSSKTNLTIEEIEKSIKISYPDLKLFYRKNLTGRHLVVQKTSLLGIGIWIKNDIIKINEVLPSIKMAFLMGAGAPLILSIVKMKHKNSWEEFKRNIERHISENYL